MNTAEGFPSTRDSSLDLIHRLTYGATVSPTATTPWPSAPPPSDRDTDGVAATVSAPERLGVLPWRDGLGAETTHDTRSAYVETFWLPILGPSTTLLLRRIASELEHSPDGFEMDCIATSRELGLGVKLTRKSPFLRTIDRCVKFKAAKRRGDVIFVRQRLLSLSYYQVNRLPIRLQELHDAWTIDPQTDGEHRRTELVRATHLARTLLSLGESTTAAERQLHQWHFHPSISWHAVQWAQTDQSEADVAGDVDLASRTVRTVEAHGPDRPKDLRA